MKSKRKDGKGHNPGLSQTEKSFRMNLSLTESQFLFCKKKAKEEKLKKHTDYVRKLISSFM